MNHSFHPSVLDTSKCAKCKRIEKDHSNEAECEACGTVGPCDAFGELLLCASCLKKEYDIAINQQKIRAQQIEHGAANVIEFPARVETNQATELIQKLAETASFKKLETSKDYFNAETEPIVELEKKIMSDESIGTIQQRQYKLAEEVKARFVNFQKVLFDITELQLAVTSYMRKDQHYLNELATKLRTEEREKLHLQDINYNPTAPVKPKKVSNVPKTNDPMERLAEQYAKNLRIPIEQARIMVKNVLNQAKQS